MSTIKKNNTADIKNIVSTISYGIMKQAVDKINTHGYKYRIDEYGYLFIDLPHAVIMVHHRNFYCDRGRFGVMVEVKKEHLDKLSIDDADFFPRYFFSLQRLFDEAHDWILFNEQKLGL